MGYPPSPKVNAAFGLLLGHDTEAGRAAGERARAWIESVGAPLLLDTLAAHLPPAGTAGGGERVTLRVEPVPAENRENGPSARICLRLSSREIPVIRRLVLIVVAVVTTTTVAAAPVGAAETRTPLVGVNGFSTLIRLEPGDSGQDVAALQQALSAAGFYHSAVDGVFGRTTASAVVAFHKYLGLERNSTFSALDWIRLSLVPDPGLPDRWAESDYLEVDLTRQLLFLVEDGELTQVMPVSAGGGYVYISPRTGNAVTANTPRGDFRLKWHQLGWECDSITGWCVYKYWAFTDFYGIHGYHQVPTYPASHGCIRIETWDADWLESHLAVGMPLHVWTEPPAIPPPPPPPPPHAPLR